MPEIQGNSKSISCEKDFNFICVLNVSIQSGVIEFFVYTDAPFLPSTTGLFQ